MNNYVITKETDKYVWVKPIDFPHQYKEDRYRKFLCVGGPFDKQMKAWVQFEHFDDYYQFNNAGRSKHTSAVYIHKDILNV